MKTKICNVCKVEKTVDSFFRKGKGYQYRCKTCVKKHLKNTVYDQCDCGKNKRISSRTCPACRMQNRRQDIPKETIKTVIDLYESGKSSWQIASILGFNQTKVRRILNRNGIKLRKYDFSKDRIGKNNPKWNGHGEISGGIFGSIKRGAMLRGLSFEITKEDIWHLFKKQNGKCALSGLDICLPRSDEERITGIYTASLDRIDSSIGYTINNIQWVHKFINRMKTNLKEEEFLFLCSRVTDYNKNKIHNDIKIKTLINGER
jgi:hypothetical protein